MCFLSLIFYLAGYRNTAPAAAGIIVKKKLTEIAPNFAKKLKSTIKTRMGVSTFLVTRETQLAKPNNTSAYIKTGAAHLIVI